MTAAHRAALTRLAAAEGEVVSGEVRLLTDFGAFIDVGGVDGLCTLSEMSWNRLSHPSDVLAVGQQVEALVLRVDAEDARVLLGLKQLTPDPWQGIEQRFAVGDVASGTVCNVMRYGVFVALAEGVQGLVHRSALGSTTPAHGEVLDVRVVAWARPQRTLELELA